VFAVCRSDLEEVSGENNEKQTKTLKFERFIVSMLSFQCFDDVLSDFTSFPMFH
jgi:hypothetical protein